MFALLALLTAAVGFVLRLAKVDTDHIDFVLLTLVFVALHYLYDWRPWVARPIR